MGQDIGRDDVDPDDLEWQMQAGQEIRDEKDQGGERPGAERLPPGFRPDVVLDPEELKEPSGYEI